MANLLDQASIVLTPTAYDDGKVLCAKPSEPPYGDFDFSRNSAATRVNAQGLVENVQILSSNLVQNGDFSEEGAEEVSNGSFSQEGVELVTNGNFDTDSDWIKVNATIGGGTGNLDSTSSSSILFQQSVLTVGKTYKATLDVTNYNGLGTCALINSSGETQFEITSNGNKEFYFTQGGSSTNLSFRAVSGGIFSIDNCSVREVGQDWSLGTGWSVAEDKAVATNAGGILSQSISFVSGKTYKINYEIIVNSGELFTQTNLGSVRTITTSGQYVDYITVTTDNILRFNGNDGSPFNGSITNISVKEVLQNWSVEDYGAVSPSAVITPNTEGVKLEKTVSADWRSSFLVQPISYTSGSQYKVTFRLKNGNLPSGGNVYVRASYSSSVENIASNLVLTNDWVEYTYYFLADSGSLDISFGEVNWQNAGVGEYFYIDDVSVIEITDDTNLPRINYEGFSYQDALGSELITNGDFATDSDWSKGSGWSISGALNAAATTSTAFQINTGIVSGKTYNVTYTISNYVSGSVRIELGSGNVSVGTIRSANGTYTEYIVALGDETIYFDGIVSFTGSIDNVSVKEYLGQEVVPDSGCGSWLFEPQSTNLIPYSEDFSNADWNANTDVIIDKGYLAPDGTNNASKITVNGATPKVALFINGVGPYTKSIYARTVSGTGTLYLGEGFPSGTAVLSNVTEQWQRFEVTNTLSNFYGADFRGASTLTEVIIWGAQFEDNISYATSYIPTSGSTVTRNQDLCTNGGSLASINSTEGVLYAEIAALADDGTSRNISISDGTYSNTILLRYLDLSNNIQAVVRIGNSFKGICIFTLADTTENIKVAYKWKNGDFALWINGTEVDTSFDIGEFAPNILTELSFDRGDGTQNFFGKTKAVAVWKEALSDQELADLTYPTPTDPTFALDFDTIATDFTFARGSEATYVDAQGLIQSTNEIGPELVTNGDFLISGTPSTNTYSLGWYSNTANVSITNGTLILTNSALENSSRAYITDGVSSTSVLATNKSYKLQYEVVANNGVSNLNYIVGSVAYAAPTTIGTHIIYFESGSSAVFQFRNRTTNSNIVFDSVSVKEVITATNTPRLDYSTGAEAFLLEPQSTNLIPYSEDFSQASWLNVGSPAITSNYGISPDGTLNSTRVQFAGSSNSLYDTIPHAIGDTSSIYVKGVSGETLQFGAGANVAAGQLFTLNGDWQRLDFNSTGSAIFCVGTFLSATARDIEVWGAQLEQQSYATSYIPTSGTTVTRNQETCINATPEINSEEGVLYAEISALADDGTFRSIALSDGTINNRIIIFYSDELSELRAIIAYNGIFQTIINTNINVTDTNKIALKYRLNDVALWINGVEISVGNSATMPLGLNRLSFDRGDGANNFFGNTKDLQYYPKALSDAELIKLTT